MGVLKLYRGKELSFNPTIGSEEINLSFAKGAVAIDCGANVGIATEQFSNAGLEVYAFEPNWYAYNILEEKFKNNPNVTCYQKAVTNQAKSGIGRLFLHQKANINQIHYSTGSSTTSDKHNVDENNFLVVEMISISEFIKSLDKPVKLLKIDVEGTEADILNDLFETELIYKIPHILVETHERKVPSSQEPLKLIRERIEKENLKNISLDWI
tara:strand:- start:2638 stop:3273 length:636 start_codon:yes stop_codon:yes gene_type:complete